MSENTQRAPSKKINRGKPKRKFTRVRLPTPPPDPMLIGEDEPQDNAIKDTTFLEYINSLQREHPRATRLDSLFAPIIATEDAFDHLDKLYKLMEQMLNLKQQNAKLQKRIRDLEHLKNLQSIYRNNFFEDIPEVEADATYAEGLLDNLLAKKEFKPKSWSRSRLRQSLLKRQRIRSSSLQDKIAVEAHGLQNVRRASAGNENPSKVSKWTKVKAAFKWEKASPSVSVSKSQDSGIGGIHPIEYELPQYLRIPSISDERRINTDDLRVASTPGTLSSASSTDDMQRKDADYHSTIQQFSDDEHYQMDTKSKDSDNYRSCLSMYNGKSDVSDVDDEDENEETAKELSAIPPQIVTRYRQVVADDERKHEYIPKTASKWTRVKKAFLQSSTLHNDFEDPQTTKYIEESRKIYEEIERNYKQLQRKLSLEFKDKSKEWEKSKHNTPTSCNQTHVKPETSDDHRDEVFVKKMEEWQKIKALYQSPPTQIISRDNLAPDFKKKLEEWQKIKKRGAKDDSATLTKTKKKLGEWSKWKSVSSNRDEHPRTEQQFSDDFLKKLDEWRKLKEPHRYPNLKEKTPSPQLARREFTAAVFFKEEQENEDHCNKQIDKTDRERRKLERERQKYLQREEKLTKLRRTVMGDGNKKDVLVHTPSGFYRFEGISRKFTQKLCEWEQAQGIGPEASTFALLTSNFTPHVAVDIHEQTTYDTVGRVARSKSVESLAFPSFSQTCASAGHHPSSLSLNDVEELERQCLNNSSRESSIHNGASFDAYEQENEEPEAVIVEIEDVEEETAAPLKENSQEKHFPIYQHEKPLSFCEESSIVVPCYESVDPNQAQFSYFLIEEIIKLIKKIEEGEQCTRTVPAFGGQHTESHKPEAKQLKTADPEILHSKEEVYHLQNQRSNAVYEKLLHLQAIHSENLADISEANQSESIEAARISFSELLQMTEELQHSVRKNIEGSINQLSQIDDITYSDVSAITSEILSKLIELKMILTAFFSAADETAAQKKIKSCRSRGRTSSKLCRSANVSRYNLDHERQIKLKRGRLRKNDFCSKTIESDDSEGLPNEATPVEPAENVTIDPEIVRKLVIPTKTNYLTALHTSPIIENKQSPEVFVRTTRKVFSPINEAQPKDSAPFVKDNNTAAIDNDSVAKQEDKENQLCSLRLPPLPSSPTPQRKVSKEISPSIRLMLAKYTQMISEGTGSTRSIASSGSASPGWRSPVNERRVLAQRERYLEEVKKIESKNFEVTKSASVSVLNSTKPILQDNLMNSNNNQTNKILRSTSATAIQTKSRIDIATNKTLKLTIAERPQKEQSEERQLQKPKRELSQSSSNSSIVKGPSSAPVFSETKEPALKYPARSRFSQISMGSESSCDSSAYEGMLVKSVSAGMINVDEDTYRTIDPAFHQEGYLSLPRSVQKQKGFLGGKLSNIAAKFRKVKMRRSKNSKKMNTVSALCRQSLVVDINPENEETAEPRRESLTVPDNKQSSSGDTSPSSSRSGSWIRRSGIFKAL